MAILYMDMLRLNKRVKMQPKYVIELSRLSKYKSLTPSAEVKKIQYTAYSWVNL